jgi:hypothetical protein
MASNFAQYTNGVVMPTGISEAGANVGRFAQQGLSSFGASLGEGLQAYNENKAKDQILTSEAEALGSQIQQYAQMFGNSPEHAEFAKSLQPYIEKLSKVPSMSLTQKMGTVTSVKAGFANIGQNLQAFEMMRKEKLNRDFWDAKNTTPLADIVTDPVMIAKGQAPWSDRKTFDQNIADFRALAQSAVDSTGAAIDINKATNLYKESIKRTIKTGRDIKGRPIAPETLSALQDQIAKAEGYQENEMTTDGVTDYSKEANLYESLSKSASDIVKEKKAIADKTNAPEADTIEAWKDKKRTAQGAINVLTGKTINTEAYNKAMTSYDITQKDAKVLHGKRVEMWKQELSDNEKELARIPKRLEELANAADRIPTTVTDKDGNIITNPALTKNYAEEAKLRKRREELQPKVENPRGEPVLNEVAPPTQDQFRIAGDTTENAPENLAAYAGVVKNADKNIERLQFTEKATKEIPEIDKAIAKLDKKIEDGEYISNYDFLDRLTDWMSEGTDSININGIQSMARMSFGFNRKAGDEITPELARYWVQAGMEEDPSGMAIFGAAITPNVGGNIPKLTAKEERNIADAYKEAMSLKRSTSEYSNGDPVEIKKKLLERKALLETRVGTGKMNPTPTELSKANTAKAKANAPEQETLLGVDRTMAVGTKQREVAMSVDRQEKAMAGFFQKKYGYVPAGFSETFKANTPEANFKTMETPYGAFMYDGKSWTQIKTQAPMNAKEAGELAAYKFSNPDGSPKQFANSGIYLSGNFEGTSTELAKFRVEYRSLAHAERSIERLIQINDMTGESLSPTLRGEATALLPAIKAALRTEIIGVGTVSNYEQELINDVVSGAADFWSLEASDRAKLSVILARVQDSIADVPAIYGLTVHRQGNSRNVEGALRERLQSSGGKSRVELDYEARGGKGKINYQAK